MTYHITIEKMKQLRLFGMQRTFQSLRESGQYQNLTQDEIMAMLIDSEWDDRERRKIERYLKAARFRYQASIQGVDYSSPRNLDRNQILHLSDCTFIDRKEDLLITGPTGVGKSYLASALGREACLKGYRALYLHMGKLLRNLKKSRAEGGYDKEITRISRQDLIILEDFGLQTLDDHARLSLMEIIEDRHRQKSTIITSQLPVSRWHDVIGEKTIADAILDRIVHTAHRIELKGESMRKKRAEGSSQN